MANIDLIEQNDKFHVLMNSQLVKIKNYRTEITNINDNLVKAQQALSTIPGVDAARQGITASIQENYDRLTKLQTAEKAANDLFTAIYTQYQNLDIAINELPEPAAPQTNPRLTMQNEQQPTNNMGANGPVITPNITPANNN